MVNGGGAAQIAEMDTIYAIAILTIIAEAVLMHRLGYPG